MTPMIPRLMATALTCLTAFAAQAADIVPMTQPDMGCVLRLSGPIAQGDAEKLVKATPPRSLDSPIQRLCLDSAGGSLTAAALLADTVAQLGLGTALAEGAICESACAVVFMAGRYAPPETDIPYRPDRLLHPRARLGFHAPRLSVPEGQYDGVALGRAYSVALSSIGEILQLRSRHSLIWPDSLLLTLLNTPPDDMTYVETVGQAARWQIEVAPVALPTKDLEAALTYGCLNADGGMLDSRPDASFWYGRALPFRYNGFGPDSLDVATADGFRAEAAASCQLYLRSATDQFSEIGVAEIAGGLPTEPVARTLFPFALHDPTTLIADLPVASEQLDDGAAFFAALSDLARAALSGVGFDSCWVSTPEVKVVNVEEFVNLRSAPGFDGQVLREAPLGERFRVLGTQTLHSTGDAGRAETCRTACNQQALTPDANDAVTAADQCISRNVFWYEVMDLSGQTGFVSRKYLSD